MLKQDNNIHPMGEYASCVWVKRKNYVQCPKCADKLTLPMVETPLSDFINLLDMYNHIHHIKGCLIHWKKT